MGILLSYCARACCHSPPRSLRSWRPRRSRLTWRSRGAANTAHPQFPGFPISDRPTICGGLSESEENTHRRWQCDGGCYGPFPPSEKVRIFFDKIHGLTRASRVSAPCRPTRLALARPHRANRPAASVGTISQWDTTGCLRARATNASPEHAAVTPILADQ